jgi:cob(I)alamin adenosyltransferase
MSMKIYTRSGDDGSTGLFGGQRVSKADARIECYGTIDELNAAIGLAVVVADDEIIARLRAVQNELFVIGAMLATPSGDESSGATIPALHPSAVQRLESQIDAADTVLPPLRNFILPGGCECSARLHLARTICRRAERLLVAFARDHQVDPLLLIYLNRLSDWLFVQARLANHQAGIEDSPWEK